MYLDYTPEQYALKDELRAIMQEIMTDEMREEFLMTWDGESPPRTRGIAPLSTRVLPT